MTDTMINSDLTPGTAASVPSGAPAQATPVPVTPVPVTGGAATRPEVDSSWGLLLVPILICAALVLYISLI